MKLAILWPDTHRPYHHKKAVKPVLDVISDLKPNEIVILGDYADFYCVSLHTKDPRVVNHLLSEIEDVNAGLDELDQLFP